MALTTPLRPAGGPENGKALGGNISFWGIHPFQPTKVQLPGCLACAFSEHEDGARTQQCRTAGMDQLCLPSTVGAARGMGADSLPHVVSPELGNVAVTCWV